MNTRHDVTELLRGFDPASPATTGLSPRAATDLESIVSTAVNNDERALASPSSRTLGRPGARRFRWGVAVAVVGAGVLVLTVRAPGESAYASWTPSPTGVTADFDGAAADACQEWWSEPPVPDTGRSVEEAELEPIMAETRGQYSLVLGESPNGYESVCLSESIDPNGTGGGGGYSLVKQGGVSITADEILVTGYDSSSTDEGWRRVSNVSIVSGHLGDEVASITIVTPQGFDVRASVLNGRFLAWWPWGSTSFPSGGLPDLSFNVALSDGKTVEGLTLDDVSNLKTGD